MTGNDGVPESQPSVSSPPTNLKTEEIEAQIAHAVWLLGWHNKRSDSFDARSVAVLGFSGVILALIGQSFASAPANVDYSIGIKVTLAISTGLLVVTSILCIIELSAQKTGIVDITQLRVRWHDWKSNPATRGKVHAYLAEGLLHGNQLHVPCPLDEAKSEANRRAKWLTLATWTLSGSMLSLAILIVQIVWRA